MKINKILLLAFAITILILSTVAVQAYVNEEAYLQIGETYEIYKNGEKYDINIVSIDENNKVSFTVNGEYEDLYQSGGEKVSELNIYADKVHYDENEVSNNYVKLILDKEEFVVEELESALDDSIDSSDNEITSSSDDETESVLSEIDVTYTGSCRDSDKGLDYYTKGLGKGKYSGSDSGVIIGLDGSPYSKPSDTSYSIYYDHCLDETQLNEAYCGADGSLEAMGYNCPNGCSNGVCLKEPIAIEQCIKEGKSIKLSHDSSLRCCSGLKPYYEGNNGVCYNPNNGKPRCMHEGSKSEGWYYIDRETTSNSGSSGSGHGIVISSRESSAGSNNIIEPVNAKSTKVEIREAKYKLLSYADCGTSNNQVDSCKDSDGGHNVFEMGTVKREYSVSNSVKNVAGAKSVSLNTDVCIRKTNNGWGNTVKKSDYLVEYSCPSKTNKGKTIYYCENGCVNGACVKSEEAPQPVQVDKYDLASYPKFFLDNGERDVKLVVGAQAAVADVIALTDIGASIQEIAISSDKESLGVLDTDVDTLAQNLISVGSPCVNTVSYKLLGGPQDCNEGVTEGYALIKLVEEEGAVQVLVYGYADADTQAAADVLANWDEYNLRGRLVRVKTSTKEIEILDEINVVEEISSETSTQVSDYILEEELDIEPLIVENDYESSGFKAAELVTSAKAKCNGCLKDNDANKCLPYGTRLIDDEVAKFCDISKDFVDQKSKEKSCQNNYECTTNQCIDGSCIGSDEISMFRKAINKILSIFG